MTWTHAFDEPGGLDHAELTARLGGKGANLAVMVRDLALPVPPGFVITTDACRTFLGAGWPPGLDDELRARMRDLEAAVGRRFADPRDPLLVSVRSGAPVSMPGMLDTILDLGLNEETTQGLAGGSGDPGFAAVCRSRFESMYRDIVGVEEVPSDPWEQLRGAIGAVFGSWNSPRARTYREREGIPGDLGTAVIVQAMVFGNRGPGSGTGVLFTRDPATGAHQLYGDVLFGAQGEDVVAGTHATEPVSVLETRLPDVWSQLCRFADQLERHHGDACDIEFTIEEGRLWMLQNRVAKRSAQAALRMAVDMAEDESFPLSRADAVRRVAHLLDDPPMIAAKRSSDAPRIAVGLPASPGLASGEIATSAVSAVEMSAQGRTVILVRPETSPDDVHGMARAAGILTATGGLASHAAVVARGWDIPAVVGAGAMSVRGDAVSIGERTFREGELISIDGSTGDVFAGSIDGVSVVAPEATTLLAWAQQLGVPVGAPIAAPSSAERGTAEEGAVVTRDDVVRTLLIKGFVTPDLLAPALGIDPEQTAEHLDRLVADGVAELNGGMFRLSEDGRAMALDRLAQDRERWGSAAAEAALDGFLALDGRVKTIVTAWQMREVDGQQTFNDHTDATYDQGVLADLAALHAEAMTWVDPLTAGFPRLASYASRLEAAAGRAAAGEGAYIASPRVDSYHGVWFELHEELILLAGRTRADEVAAGRA
jgi:pyruvate, orthophosphate dikinase